MWETQTYILRVHKYGESSDSIADKVCEPEKKQHKLLKKNTNVKSKTTNNHMVTISKDDSNRRMTRALLHHHYYIWSDHKLEASAIHGWCNEP